MPNKAHDAAADHIADLFGDPELDLPFRIPTLLEQERDAEFIDFYPEVTVAKHLLTETKMRSLIGSFLEPSALKAAFGCGTVYSIKDFVGGNLT